MGSIEVLHFYEYQFFMLTLLYYRIQVLRQLNGVEVFSKIFKSSTYNSVLEKKTANQNTDEHIVWKKVDC